MDGLLEHLEAVVEVGLPEWLAEFGERVAAPDVVDQNVETLVPLLDAGAQLFHFGRNCVVNFYGNAAAACCGDEFRGFFDGFGAAESDVMSFRASAGSF